MTVSRVVNGERNVREATRAAVLAAVKELRYAPNPAARSLAGAQRPADRAALRQPQRRLPQRVPAGRAR